MGNVTRSIAFKMLLVCFLSLYFDIYAFSFIMISLEISSIQKTFCQHNLVSEVVNEVFLVDDKSHSENFFIHVYPIDNAILEWMHTCTCSFEHTRVCSIIVIVQICLFYQSFPLTNLEGLITINTSPYFPITLVPCL